MIASDSPKKLIFASHIVLKGEAGFVINMDGDILGGDMDNIIELKRHRVFSLSEAQEIIPIINKITKTYSQQVEALIRQIDSLGENNETLTISLEKKVNELVEAWQTKVEKLGGLTRGLWLADFDSGDGYYCWKFPEERIEFWHGYSEGFSGRIKIGTHEIVPAHGHSHEPELTL